MATSAFKSTSRRGNAAASGNSSPKKAPLRRSLSVSAMSRSSNLDIISEYSNKRDNPLFCGSPPDDLAKEFQPETTIGVAKSAVNASRVSGLTSKETMTPTTASADGRRGRSTARNSEVLNGVSGGRKETGRSLSRVDTGRRHRSVSRGHYGLSEIDTERESTLTSSYGIRRSSSLVSNDVSKLNLRKTMDNKNVVDRAQHSRIQRSQSAVSVSSPPNPCWDDGASTGSFSEVDEKTIKEVSEQMKPQQPSTGDPLGDDTATSGIYETVRSEVRRAISDIQNDLAFRRNNDTTITSTKVPDLSPDMVNPDAIELVLDIRSEYARKLEESQERARKLRADLEVEEYREQELGRILKEVLPDPKTTNGQKSRFRRKTSNERKKMSKSLAEEAMTYFDECVSISTFDSSDFSAPEDPPLSSVGVTTPTGGNADVQQDRSPSVLQSYCSNSSVLRSQKLAEDVPQVDSHEHSSLTTNRTSNELIVDQASSRGNNTTERGRKFQFSFGDKSEETVSFGQDIRKYVKSFEKEVEEVSVDSEILQSNYFSVDEYNMQDRAEDLLFDRVFLQNRIESGNLHLCAGGLMISFSPFASII